MGAEKDMSKIQKVLQVFITFPSREDAERIGGLLVSEKLAACSQVIGPISSTYWWDGEIQSSQEWLCLMKTSVERFPELEKLVQREHPYEVPEIAAVPLERCSESYISWMNRVIG